MCQSGARRPGAMLKRTCPVRASGAVSAESWSALTTRATAAIANSSIIPRILSSILLRFVYPFYVVHAVYSAGDRD